MGRRKLEIKRIEDKSSRRVAFSKRRTGLFKKARHLSVVCDVDVAVIVFSESGKLYEFCNSDTNSVGLLSRLPDSCLLPEEESTKEGACKDMGFNNQCTRFRTCKELLQSVRRLDEEPNEVSVTEMTKLEEDLSVALLHTRSRKTQLMMENISSFHEHERKLTKEKEELKQQVASVKQKYDVDDDGGDSADRHDYHITNPYPLLTLPLFKE